MRLDADILDASACVMLAEAAAQNVLSHEGAEMTERLLLNVLQALPEPVLVATLEQTICFANDSARATLVPSTRDDIVGSPLSSLVTSGSETFSDWLKKPLCSTSFVSEQFDFATCQGSKSFWIDACSIRDDMRAYLLIRLRAPDAQQSAVQSLAVRVDMLQQEIAMRRAAEARLQESLIELERAKKQLEQLATVDSLTGIPNRRSIDETLRREWSKAMRNGEPLAAIMVDIDHFKDYNDAYGHQAGDLCLKQVANAIRASLRRSTDFVGRYGGEEFLVLLENSDWEKAAKMAEKICEAVRELRIPHSASATAKVVTVSAGVNVTIPKPQSSIEKFIGDADAALYQAKRKGRKQFVLHQRAVKARLQRRKVRS